MINAGSQIVEMFTNRQGSIYTMLPARVVKYDSDTQLCDVEVSVRRHYAKGPSRNITKLKDVPVGFYYGHDWVIAATLSKGDAVLLIFPMMNIDNWLTGDRDKIYDAGGYQFHNLDGAFAIPVAFTHNKPTRDSRFKDKFHIVKGSNFITMGEEGVNITAGSSNILVHSSGAVDVNAPTINLNGNVNISGNLVTSGTTTSAGALTAPSASVGGKQLHNHTHNYTDDGATKTTTPNN